MPCLGASLKLPPSLSRPRRHTWVHPSNCPLLVPPLQALLGGFALLNFFLTYLLYNKQSLQQFLQYYSPDAMEFSRAYFTLTTFSVIAATARQVQRS